MFFMEDKENETKPENERSGKLVAEPLGPIKPRRSVLKEFDPLAPDSPCPPQKKLRTPSAVIDEEDIFEDAETSLISFMCPKNKNTYKTTEKPQSPNNVTNDISLPVPDFSDYRRDDLRNPNDTADLSYMEAVENLSQVDDLMSVDNASSEESVEFNTKNQIIVQNAEDILINLTNEDVHIQSEDYIMIDSLEHIIPHTNHITQSAKSRGEPHVSEEVKENEHEGLNMIDSLELLENMPVSEMQSVSHQDILMDSLEVVNSEENQVLKGDSTLEGQHVEKDVLLNVSEKQPLLNTSLKRNNSQDGLHTVTLNSEGNLDTPGTFEVLLNKTEITNTENSTHVTDGNVNVFVNSYAKMDQTFEESIIKDGSDEQISPPLNPTFETVIKSSVSSVCEDANEIPSSIQEAAHVNDKNLNKSFDIPDTVKSPAIETESDISTAKNTEFNTTIKTSHTQEEISGIKESNQIITSTGIVDVEVNNTFEASSSDTQEPMIDKANAPQQTFDSDNILETSSKQTEVPIINNQTNTIDNEKLDQTVNLEENKDVAAENRHQTEYMVSPYETELQKPTSNVQDTGDIVGTPIDTTYDETLDSLISENLKNDLDRTLNEQENKDIAGENPNQREEFVSHDKTQLDVNNGSKDQHKCDTAATLINSTFVEPLDKTITSIPKNVNSELDRTVEEKESVAEENSRREEIANHNKTDFEETTSIDQDKEYRVATAIDTISDEPLSKTNNLISENINNELNRTENIEENVAVAVDKPKQTEKFVSHNEVEFQKTTSNAQDEKNGVITPITTTFNEPLNKTNTLILENENNELDRVANIEESKAVAEEHPNQTEEFISHDETELKKTTSNAQDKKDGVVTPIDAPLNNTNTLFTSIDQDKEYKVATAINTILDEPLSKTNTLISENINNELNRTENIEENAAVAVEKPKQTEKFVSHNKIEFQKTTSNAQDEKNDVITPITTTFNEPLNKTNTLILENVNNELDQVLNIEENKAVAEEQPNQTEEFISHDETELEKTTSNAQDKKDGVVTPIEAPLNNTNVLLSEKATNKIIPDNTELNKTFEDPSEMTGNVLENALEQTIQNTDQATKQGHVDNQLSINHNQIKDTILVSNTEITSTEARMESSFLPSNSENLNSTYDTEEQAAESIRVMESLAQSLNQTIDIEESAITDDINSPKSGNSSEDINSFKSANTSEDLSKEGLNVTLENVQVTEEKSEKREIDKVLERKETKEFKDLEKALDIGRYIKEVVDRSEPGIEKGNEEIVDIVTEEDCNKVYRRQDTQEFEVLERECKENVQHNTICEVKEVNNHKEAPKIICEVKKENNIVDINIGKQQESKILKRQETEEFEDLERKCNANVQEVKEFSKALKSNEDTTQESDINAVKMETENGKMSVKAIKEKPIHSEILTDKTDMSVTPNTGQVKVKVSGNVCNANTVSEECDQTHTKDKVERPFAEIDLNSDIVQHNVQNTIEVAVNGNKNVTLYKTDLSKPNENSVKLKSRVECRANIRSVRNKTQVIDKPIVVHDTNRDINNEKSHNEVEKQPSEYKTTSYELKSDIDKLQTEKETMIKENMRKDKYILSCTLDNAVLMDTNKRLRILVTDHEKLIANQSKDLIKIKEEAEMYSKRLTSLEMAFADVFEKYEKTKTIIEAYKKNEEVLLGNIQSADYQITKLEAKCSVMKEQVEERLNEAREQVFQEKEKYKQDIGKLQAMLKRYQIKSSSLETALKQKTEECLALSSLCDDITGKQM